MKGWIRLGCSVLLLTGTAGLAAAQGRPGRRPGEGDGPRHAAPMKQLAAFLGLTEEQRAAWEAAHRDVKSKVEPLHDQMRTLHDQLKKALEAAKPDPTAVGKLVISIHGLQDQMRKAHEGLEQQLEGILTPEQKAKFEAFKAAREMGRGHRGPGGRGFGGPDGGGPGPFGLPPEDSEGPPPLPPDDEDR